MSLSTRTLLAFFASIFLLNCQSVLAQGLPYKFVENQKQWDSEVLFRTDVPNGYLFFHNNRLTYSFYDASSLNKGHPHHDDTHASNSRVSVAPSNPTSSDLEPIKAHGVQVSFLGANSNVDVTGNGKQSVHHNYFLGKDPTKWSSHVNVFEGVTYQSLYNEIDLQFIQTEGILKYEFLVDAGGNPNAIQLSYEGAEAVYLEDGNLHIETTLNTIIERAPYSYQIIEGDTVKIPSKFSLDNDILSFEFPEGYDINHQLVIDPLLVFSSYSQSVSDNWGNTATYAEDGNSYVAGIVFGTNFPTTVGAFDVSKDFFSEDVVIMKYNAPGTAVLYSTFLGGNNSEIPISMIVNSKNQLIVMGITGSDDFPTRNGFDNSFGGGSEMVPFPYPDGNGGVNRSNPLFSVGTDIFLAILNESGNQLVNSTYLGGSQNDGVMGGRFFSNGDFETSPLMRNYGDAIRGEIILDAQDNIYIASASESSDFPTSASAFDRTLGGLRDAVITKMNDNITQVIWSTFLGGTNVEGGFGLTLDNANNVFVVGGTASTNFPTNINSINPTYRQGSTDGYIAHISSDGSSLLNSTFLGTNAYDQAYLVDLDSEGNPVVFGQTLGFYPITGGLVYNNSNAKQFLHKLDPSLSTTFFSTTIGSSGSPGVNIIPTAFTITNCNSIYLAGWGGGNAGNAGFNSIFSSTVNMPITPNAIQRSTDGADFYVAILSEDARELQFGSYLGAFGARGDHVDGGTSRFDPNGVIYQAVCSCTPDLFPGGQLTVQRENCNMLLFKIDLALLAADFTPSVKEGCAPLEISFANQSQGGQTFSWDTGDGTILSGRQDQTHTYTEAGEYIIELTVSDPTSCLKTDVHYDTIQVFPADFTITADTLICKGDSIEISADGGETYHWLNDDIANKTIPKQFVSPESTTDYQVIAINEFGCEDTLSVNIRVIPTIEVNFEYEFVDRCEEPGLVKLTNKSVGTDSLLWDIGGLTTSASTDSILFKFESAGDYIIRLETLFTNGDSCIKQAVAFDTIQVRYPNFAISNDTLICFGDSVQLIASGAIQYRWLNNDVENDTIPNPFVKPTATTNYQVFVQDSLGCTDTLMVNVEVQPIIEANFEFQFPDRCETPGIVEFFNTSTGTQDFIWKISDLVTFENRDSLTYEFTETGDYVIQLEVLDTADCIIKKIHTDTVKVRFPAFKITSDTAICEGSSIQLLAEGAMTYQWLNSDIERKYIPNPVVSPLASTTYHVLVVDSFGCSDTLSVAIDVIENVNVDFSHEFVDRCVEPGLVKFTNQSKGTKDFVWSIDNLSSVENQDTLRFNFETDGRYIVSLEARDTTECVIRKIFTDTIEVIYPNYTITSDTVICEGESIHLMADGAVSYQWIEGDNINNREVSTPTVTPSQTQTYKVLITNQFGCQDTLSTPIEVLPVIEVDFDFKIIDPCANPNVVELINKSKGTSNFRWEIRGTQLDTLSNIDTLTYNFLENREYIVSLIALDSNKCSMDNIKSDTLLIQFPIFTVSNDTTICEGSEAILSAEGGASYQWFLNNELINTSNQLIASPDTTTTYKLIVFDGEGCSQTFPVFVEVIQEIEVSFKADYFEKCEAPHQIKFINGSTGVKTFSWLVNGEVVSTNTSEFTYTFGSEGIFEVVLQSDDPNPCEFKNTFSETFEIEFVEFRTPSDTTICFGDVLPLQVSGLDSYIWQPAEGITNLTLSNPVVSPTQPTTYTVTGINNDCRLERTIQVNVVPDIQLEFDVNFISACNELPKVNFTNQSEGGVEYTWQLGNGESVSATDLQYQYSEEGEFQITLIGTNDICQEQIQKTINIEKFIPPNAFSPNGDDKNQFFDLGEQGFGQTIKIFNRWGEEVFQSASYQNNWDGDDLPEGVYLYQLSNQEGVSCRGWVKILR